MKEPYFHIYRHVEIFQLKFCDVLQYSLLETTEYQPPRDNVLNRRPTVDSTVCYSPIA